MVETIGPMVRRSSKEVRTRVAHVVGGGLGGLATGTLAGGFGSIVLPYGYEDPAALVAALGISGVVAIALFRDAVARGGNLGAARQTPRSWRYVLPAAWAAGLNGFDLGLGWTTRAYFASTLVVPAIAFAAADAGMGAAVGAAFGLGRSLTVVLLTLRSSAGSPDDTEALIARRPLVRLGNAVALTQFLLVVLGLTTGLVS